MLLYFLTLEIIIVVVESTAAFIEEAQIFEFIVYIKIIRFRRLFASCRFL